MLKLAEVGAKNKPAELADVASSIMHDATTLRRYNCQSATLSLVHNGILDNATSLQMAEWQSLQRYNAAIAQLALVHYGRRDDATTRRRCDCQSATMAVATTGHLAVATTATLPLC